MIQPRADMVLIQPQKDVALSTVLVMPDKMDALPPCKGRVLAVGPKVRDVKKGDTVHFERFDWTPAPDECIIIREGEILARE